MTTQVLARASMGTAVIRIRFIQALRLSVEMATALIFVSFVIVIAAQVFWRYALNDSIFWAEEYVRFALYWMTMLSVAIAADRKAHIVMDLLHASLGDEAKRLLDWVNAAVSVAFLAVLSYYGAKLVGLSWETISPVTETSMSWVYLATSVGSLSAIIFTIDALVRRKESA